MVAQDPSGGKIDHDQMSQGDEDVLSSELLADTDYGSSQGCTVKREFVSSVIKRGKPLRCK